MKIAYSPKVLVELLKKKRAEFTPTFDAEFSTYITRAKEALMKGQSPPSANTADGKSSLVALHDLETQKLKKLDHYIMVFENAASETVELESGEFANLFS